MQKQKQLSGIKIAFSINGIESTAYPQTNNEPQLISQFTQKLPQNVSDLCVKYKTMKLIG